MDIEYYCIEFEAFIAYYIFFIPLSGQSTLNR